VTNSNINMSLYQEHVMNSSTLLIQKHLQENMDRAKQLKKDKRKGALEDLDFDELISKFIAKDTESNIHESLLESNSN
jgi:isopropylmalate/homocitrate/citramalate synthase